MLPLENDYINRASALAAKQNSTFENSKIMQPVGVALVTIATLTSLFSRYSTVSAFTFKASIANIVTLVSVALVGIYLLAKKTYADVELGKLRQTFIKESLEKPTDLVGIESLLDSATQLGIHDELQMELVKHPQFKQSLLTFLSECDFDTDMALLGTLKRLNLVSEESFDLVNSTKNELDQMSTEKTNAQTAALADRDAAVSALDLELVTKMSELKNQASAKAASIKDEIQKLEAAKIVIEQRQTSFNEWKLKRENELSALEQKIADRTANASPEDTNLAKDQEDLKAQQTQFTTAVARLPVRLEEQKIECVQQIEAKQSALQAVDADLETKLQQMQVEFDRNKLEVENAYQQSLKEIDQAAMNRRAAIISSYKQRVTGN